MGFVNVALMGKMMYAERRKEEGRISQNRRSGAFNVNRTRIT